MKYVCLGFIDEKKFAQIPQEVAQKMKEECFAYDDELRRGGHFLGGEALDSVRNAVTLRIKDGKIEATDGPVSLFFRNLLRTATTTEPGGEPASDEGDRSRLGTGEALRGPLERWS